MNDDNRLEDSRLDADHIDRLTRELAAMQARAEAAEAAIAEAAEDYANLASTSGDMLKLAVARAEKAEAALATANDGLYVAINQSKGTT